MTESLSLITENPNLLLRAWANESDDNAYFEAVDENRDHLSQYGDTTASKYPTVNAVTQRRLDGGKDVRLGIWDKDALKGGITAKPNDKKSEVEIGYWLRASATGKGYATLAVNALTNYLKPNYNRVFAEVHEENLSSAKVLQRAGYVPVGSIVREWGNARIFEAI